ncbi:hypothetical protein H0O03_00270 [Candidatus Micrarchaeota archaeon]|nr:hypothetical protein [Candidatus Micrarchaeota archaeon]
MEEPRSSWRKQPIHFLKEKVVLADGSYIARKKFVRPPEPLGVDREVVAHNSRMLAGEQFKTAANRESLCGTAAMAGFGTNRVSVNAVLDPRSGKIIVFSNAPEERLGGHAVTFVVNFDDLFRSSGKLPTYIERIVMSKGVENALSADETKLHGLVTAARQANEDIAGQVRRFRRKQLLLTPFRRLSNIFGSLRRRFSS